MMNDLIDNKLLKENFKNKNYIYCINTLQNEIKHSAAGRPKGENQNGKILKGYI